MHDAHHLAKVRGTRLDDPVAVEEFVRGHWAVVWRAAYAVTADSQLAEDTAQEAFVRAFRSLHQRKQDPLAPWLRRIAINCAIDQLRRRPSEWMSEQVPEEPSSGVVCETDDDLLEAVLALPPERRVVVVLHFWFDYTRREISELLDVPQGTVASRLSRALDDLHTRVTGVSGVHGA